MADRGQFWSPIPEWSSVLLDRNGVRIAPVFDDARMQMISGDPDRFLSLTGLSAIGPRDRSDGRRYALRLAPDRLLLVSDATPPAVGWSADGYAVSDVTDGYLRFDVVGSGAGDVMAFGAHYDWHSQEDRPLESATMLFAGLKTFVGRLESGWRLHIERSLAPTLWRWLEKI
jgi:sarcosine oxidase gamma subunit